MSERKQQRGQWSQELKAILTALVQLRLIAGERQEDTAASLGWLRVTLSQIEGAKTMLRVSDLLSLCNHYRVDPARVLAVADAIRQEISARSDLSTDNPIQLALKIKSGFRNI